MRRVFVRFTCRVVAPCPSHVHAHVHMRARHNGRNNRGQRQTKTRSRARLHHNPPPTLPQHLFARRRVAPWRTRRLATFATWLHETRGAPFRPLPATPPRTTVLTGRRPVPPPRSPTWTHGRANIPRGIALSGHGEAGCRACVGRSGEMTTPARTCNASRPLGMLCFRIA
jgi:hypothetical protein